ncbi:DUF3306 domain-containing protein [Shewanella sp. 1_MG-2023]|uniref:DUF3306 domain-containing protein n=1 Tax=unclassified Shewanella TaxID=196818 RepID=UPI000C836650|nr:MULTISPECIES: DUF3306 domain-containing protein [unclassified Shewanella]MDO6612770.1 DUF3306 domain-containing protein [Shewanella sp. 7_MG-2023]MDO6772731.1 DUF3306 domain-containing protein [Shewanella sp. 2_MG-2023]MDO6794895.1 DUF3306 domain-containing protein [Shewanella sp. 1_MG-2023]PMG77597.1 hypothetical protein BCU84_10195 [Shewanella sp. 10N.286.51.B7]
MSDKPRGFFSRWTERREQVEAEAAELAQQEQQAQALQAQADNEEIPSNDAQAESAEADQPEKILEAEDLPDPEKIEVGGSFASFMGANVSPEAKSAALKALWKQPQYNEIDGLLEYALDYSNQPKLSPEVSAELAKKVFRNVMKDEKETAEDEELLASEGDDTVGDAADAPQGINEKSELVAETDLINQNDDLILAQEVEQPLQSQVKV